MQGRLAGYQGRIAALRPVYTAAGDATEIILDTGEIIQEGRGIRSVRRALARLYAVDLAAARQYYRKLLGQANAIPLPFSAHLVLCPVKMRRPRCRGDFTLGYVSYRQVEGVEDCTGGYYRSRIYLRSGIRLSCLNRPAFVKKQLALGRFVESHYLEVQGLARSREVLTYSMPTREEFVLLETKLDLLLQRLCRPEPGEKGFFTGEGI
ncbi:MAG: hypothetical protein ACOYEK_00935 [bacterium]|jgi:hypothetical protein